MDVESIIERIKAYLNGLDIRRMSLNDIKTMSETLFIIERHEQMKDIGNDIDINLKSNKL